MAATDPDRAGRLATAAQETAESITDEDEKAIAVLSFAQAVAAITLAILLS